MEIEPAERIKVFYCYARKDQILRNELEKHLTPLKRSGKIVTWCDREILPGTEWESKISLELNTADIILLLVSPDFICSDYCYGNEMKRAYERYNTGEACVISVILRPVLWKGTDISKFQLLPLEGKPITKWPDRDEAFANVAQGIDHVVEKLLIQKARSKDRQTRGLEKINSARRSHRTHVLVAKDERLSARQQSTGQLAKSGRTVIHRQYLVLRKIGSGGMSAVYRAKDTKSQQICAIKELSLSKIPPEERKQAIKNFKTEAKVLSSLNHANIPMFLDFFYENSRYFLVMEYINGNTLEDLLERNNRPFSEHHVLGWARQICDVLEYLHSQNPPIIFRDMKPGNIMLMPDDHIKLIDFGIARFFRVTNSTDTQLLGTPGYAPPEQYGTTQTDERSDIYALAITLFQLLTNMDAMYAKGGFGLKNMPISPQISSTVMHALRKATSIDPNDRYNNIAEFRRALLSQQTLRLRSSFNVLRDQSELRPLPSKRQIYAISKEHRFQVVISGRGYISRIKAFTEEWKQRVLAFFTRHGR